MSLCLYSCLSYPACKVLLSYAVLYRHLWPVWLYHIFPNHLINETIFQNKKLLNLKCVLIFSATPPETSLLIRRIQQGIIINPLNPELNPISYLLELLGVDHFLHVSRIRVKLLTFRLLMSYIYIYIYIYIWSTHS